MHKCYSSMRFTEASPTSYAKMKRNLFWNLQYFKWNWWWPKWCSSCVIKCKPKWNSFKRTVGVWGWNDGTRTLRRPEWSMCGAMQKRVCKIETCKGEWLCWTVVHAVDVVVVVVIKGEDAWRSFMGRRTEFISYETLRREQLVNKEHNLSFLYVFSMCFLNCDRVLILTLLSVVVVVIIILLIIWNKCSSPSS